MSKDLKLRYVPKYKRELGEGITREAIFRSIDQMHRAGLIDRAQANTIADCVWIAQSELRAERSGSQ